MYTLRKKSTFKISTDAYVLETLQEYGLNVNGGLHHFEI